MWKTYIDNALDDPQLTEFEREALSDYVITDSEYHEARGKFVQCMADKGWEVTDLSNGSYSIRGMAGTANENQGVSFDVQIACQVGSTNYIEPIYFGMLENSRGLTWAQLVRACFEKNGVAEGAGLSDDQFTDMVSAPSYHPGTPEGKLCFYDPTGSQGMTIEQAEMSDQQPTAPVTASPRTFGGSGSGGGVDGPAATG
ncbi:MAG: hypothetical protein LBI33_01490 [Propionibacteriaceae bacterium]|jgi:hypothetical protein|nr:hypothetical protein [Propionibacteriaceae bacterium]